MNTLIRKSFLFFIAGIVSFQFAFFTPQRAEAGSIDTVKSILIQIESMVPNNPFPITIGEFFALLDLVQTCKDMSDAGLMACLDGAASNPTLGPMLEGDKGNLETALKIYIDVKNSDYVQLMIDGGKPIGCAAANIFTGVDVCGLLEELAAIANAVGEAAEYAAGWLEELDVALFGQTPHMNEGQYYQERWRPYLKAYVEKSLKGSVTDDTSLTPWLNKSAFNYGGTYAEFGLDVRSLNGVYVGCIAYYSGFKDDAGPGKCNNNREVFRAKAKLFIQQAKAIQVFATVLEPSIKNQSDSWKNKINTMFDELEAKWPGKGVKDQSKYPDYIWKSIASYKDYVTKRFGSIQGNTFCLNGDYWECIDLDKGSGTYNSFAAAAFDGFYASGFTGDAGDILTSALEKIKPSLDNYYEQVKKNFNDHWVSVNSNDSLEKIHALADPAKNTLWALQASCKKLYSMTSTDKYSALCLKSEPLYSCFATIEKIWTDKDPFQMDQASLTTYLENKKPGIDACVSGATKVVNEWVRMQNLREPFFTGWIQYYYDNFPAHHKTPETINDKPLDDQAIKFYLNVAYDNCVIDNMKKTESDVMTPVSTALYQFTGMSANELMGKSGIAGVIKKDFSRKKGSLFTQPAKKIAEGFCAKDGAEAADPNRASMDAAEGFGSGVAPPSPPNDPSKRSQADIAAAQSLKSKSGCKPYQFTENGKQVTDPFHLICSDKKSYGICFEALGGTLRAAKAQCSAPYGNDAHKTWVNNVCCEKDYEDPNFSGMQVRETITSTKSVESSGAVESAKKGLLLGKDIKEDSNKNRVKKGIEANVTKEQEVDASKAIELSKKAGGIFTEKAGTVKVTPSISGSGGTVEPKEVQNIKVGERAKFKIKPNLGYKIKSITGCGFTGEPKEEFETGSVVTDCTLQITFENSKIQLLNNGARQAPAPAGTPTLEKRSLPAGRPLLNQPLQRKMVPLPPMPPVQEKQ